MNILSRYVYLYAYIYIMYVPLYVYTYIKREGELQIETNKKFVTLHHRIVYKTVEKMIVPIILVL